MFSMLSTQTSQLNCASAQLHCSTYQLYNYHSYLWIIQAGVKILLNIFYKKRLTKVLDDSGEIVYQFVQLLIYGHGKDINFNYDNSTAFDFWYNLCLSETGRADVLNYISINIFIYFSIVRFFLIKLILLFHI